MRSNFINIGNKNYLDACKIKYIVSADYNKVARLLGKYGVKRDDPSVFDATSNKETRSFLILDDGTFGITSVNAKVLRNRANGVEKPSKEKAAITEEIAQEPDIGTEENLYDDYDEDEY